MLVIYPNQRYVFVLIYVRQTLRHSVQEQTPKTKHGLRDDESTTLRILLCSSVSYRLVQFSSTTSSTGTIHYVH